MKNNSVYHQLVSLRQSPLWIYIGIACLSLMVAFIDYATGVEIRVYPFYFVPITIAASFTTLVFALLTALFCTILWVVSNVVGGMYFSHEYIWVLNTLAQFVSFTFVAYLVSELASYKELQKKLARVDALTELPNVRSFNEKAASVLELSRRLSLPITIAYIDLDNFKAVNDSYGHKKGDEVLCIASRIIRVNTRTSDVVGRLGGDEFGVLLPNTSNDGAVKVLERIRYEIECEMRSESLGVTCSIGAAVFTAAPQSLDDLINSADRAMYAVKKSGKNRVEAITIVLQPLTDPA